MTRRPGTAKTSLNELGGGTRISQEPTSGGEGPIERLVAFHGELRRTTVALTALLESAAQGRLDQTEAQRLAAFFAGPLLWHDEDEEVSMLPRLRRLELGDAERRVLDATGRAHDRLEELLEHLGPFLAELAEDAGGTEEELRAAATEARALEGLLDELMRLEEESLFPMAASRLSAEDLAEIGREMAARRSDANHRPRRAVEI